MTGQLDPPGVASGGAGAEDFELLLPLCGGAGARPPSHVVGLHGRRDAFIQALDQLVRSDTSAHQLLYDRTADVSLGLLADVLNGVGHATVQSIDLS